MGPIRNVAWGPHDGCRNGCSPEVRNLTVGDETTVLSDIRRARAAALAASPTWTAAATYLHLLVTVAKSEWCWRHDYYRIRGYPVDAKSQNPSFHMENVFEEGHEIHHKWQRWL